MPLSNSIQNSVQGNNGRNYPQFIANEFVSHDFVPADGTNSIVMVTGAPGYYIPYFRCQIDPTTTVVGGGMVTMLWTDSVRGVVGKLRFYAPNNVANPGNVTTTLQFSNEPDFILMSKNAGSVLSANLDTALTAGQARLIFRFAFVPYLWV